MNFVAEMMEASREPLLMSSDKRWVLSKVSAEQGLALDLGGGSGELRSPLRALGYEYVNLDLKPTGQGFRVKRGCAAVAFRLQQFRFDRQQ